MMKTSFRPVHFPSSGATRSYTDQQFGSRKALSTGVKVLVVDDLADNADTLGALVESYGCAVRSAYNARDGLAIAYEWIPNVIIHDLAMPGMTGFDVARTLRADPRFDGTLLVALSAYIGHADSALRYRGFDRLVTKPIDTTELAEILEMAARRQRD